MTDAERARGTIGIPASLENYLHRSDGLGWLCSHCNSMHNVVNACLWFVNSQVSL